VDAEGNAVEVGLRRSNRFSLGGLR